MQNLVTHTSLRTSLAKGNSPPTDDLLGRAGFVDALRNYLATHDAGTIVSVEGPWGSSKTHVRHSMAWTVGRPGPASAASDVPPSTPPPGALVYWLNPWLQRDVDLIGTLVLMIVEDIVAAEQREQPIGTATGDSEGSALTTTGDASIPADTDRDWPSIVKKILPELIQLVLFGVATFGGAAAAAAGAPALLAAPALWSLLRTSAPAIAQLVMKVRAARAESAEATVDEDNDHAAFAQQLAASYGAVDSLQNALTALGDLVSIARGQRSPPDRPLYVFIDDLDRCLPQTQVAVLQQLYWLSSSGASLVIVVGVDAAMLESALRIHYASEEVNAHRYLQKLFSLRAPLPYSPASRAQHLFSAFLKVEASDEACAKFTATFAACGVSPTPREYERLTDAMRLWVARGVPLTGQLSNHCWQAYWGLFVVNPDVIVQFMALDPNRGRQLVTTLRSEHKGRGIEPAITDSHARAAYYKTVFDTRDGDALFCLMRVGCGYDIAKLGAPLETAVDERQVAGFDRFHTFLRAVQRFEIPPD